MVTWFGWLENVEVKFLTTNIWSFFFTYSLNEPGILLQWQIQIAIRMLFSPTTISKVVTHRVVYYSAICHCHLLRTQLNRYQKSYLLLTASTNINYHEEIEFLIKLHHPYISAWNSSFVSAFVCWIKLQYMRRNHPQRFLCLFIHSIINNWCVSLKLLHKNTNKRSSVSYM